MKLTVVLLALLIGVIGVALRHPSVAFACSGPGPIENLLESTVIFEGRVTAVTPSGPAGLDRAPYKLEFEVLRAHKGVTAGDKLVANAFIPIPGVPIMCPQFPQDLLGKYVVMGQRPDANNPGQLFADAWSSYVGTSLSGPQYSDMSMLARLHADSDPTAPQLLVSPQSVTCGASFRLTGTRFPEGKYLLRYGGEARVIGLVDVAASGTFALTPTLAADACHNPYANGRPISIHALRASAVASAVSNLAGLVEIAPVIVAGATDRPWPALTVTPNPAACTDMLDVSGTGFQPGEQLNVGVGYGVFGHPLTADGNGAFTARLPIPQGACDEGSIRIAAKQAGYEVYSPAFWSLAESLVTRLGATRSSPPGPPDAGTGQAGARDTRHTALAVSGLFLATVGGSVLVVRRRVVGRQ